MTGSQAYLRFATSGATSRLVEHRVTQPLAFVRTFEIEGLCTAIVQSSAGGLFAGDDIGFDVTAGPSVAAAVTSGAATVVHAGAPGRGAHQRVSIRADSGAFVGWSMPPTILLPAARLATTLTVDLAEGASAVIHDGYAFHDPDGGPSFGGVELTCDVEITIGDRRVVVERGALAVADRPGVLGASTAFASVWICGPTALATIDRLTDAIGHDGLDVGVGELPYGAGAVVKLASVDAGTIGEALVRTSALTRPIR